MANILVVDDAAFMRMNIKQMLDEGGHTMVAEAADGKEAVSKYLEHKPDIVLMDITMPDMDGIDALKHIKELDKDAKVIMCSAMGQQQRVAEAIQNGAVNFIVKPFAGETLMAAIAKVLN